MARKPSVGWYVQVPLELKQEFKKLYPARSAMRKLTVAAIEWAVKVQPTINYGEPLEDRQLRFDNAPDLSGQVRPENEPRVDKPSP